jgi:hypothetical protein
MPGTRYCYDVGVRLPSRNGGEQMKQATIRFIRWTTAAKTRYIWFWGVIFWGGGTTLLAVPVLWPKESGVLLFLIPCMALGGYIWGSLMWKRVVSPRH